MEGTGLTGARGRQSGFDRRGVQGPLLRGDSGLRASDLPEGTDLKRLGEIETAVDRRGGRTKNLVDPRVSTLDAIHGRSRPEQMETLDRLDAVNDEALAARVEFPPGDVPGCLLRGDFGPVSRRAYVALERAQVVRVAGRFRGPRYTRKAMEQMAQCVAAVHVARHTPRSERSDDWPKTTSDLASAMGLTAGDLREALYQSQYHKWEERYLPKVSSAARVSIVKDVMLSAVERQLEAEPGKENANLFRTALQAEGAIHGTQKVTQVNIGSNVLNVPEGVTAEVLRARLETVNRLAQRIGGPGVQEVRDGGDAQEVAQGAGGGEIPGAPGEDAQGKGGAGAP